MLNAWSLKAARTREDLSPYLVHLTRDNRRHFRKTGLTAALSFENIWKEQTIKARRVLCIHREQILQEDPKIQAMFRVVCFTSTPLTQIKHVVGVLRQEYKFEAYGFIFKREFLYGKGAQKAIYINQYDGSWMREWADRMYELAKRSKFTVRHDFAWEREWRVTVHVKFDYDDLVGVFLPDDAKSLRKKVSAKGVPIISTEWDREQMEEELAKRERTSKVQKANPSGRVAPPGFL